MFAGAAVQLKAEVRGFALAMAAVSAVSLLAVTVDFDIPGQQLLHSLRFHLAAVSLIPILVLLSSGARWRAAIFFIIVLASAGQGISILLNQQESRPGFAGRVLGSLDVLSFNVLSKNTGGASIANYMVQSAPDIAVIMEAPALQPYLASLGATFPTRIGCESAQACDIALFSRLPVTDATIQALGPLKRMRLITAKVVVSGQTVTLVAVHLSKPYFDETAWIELTQVRALLQKIDGPIILAGDFNAAAWSGNVARFVDRAGLMPPPAYPATWPLELGAFGIPIDNMFTRGNAVIRTISAMPDAMGSNHRGLRAVVDIMHPQ